MRRSGPSLILAAIGLMSAGAAVAQDDQASDPEVAAFDLSSTVSIVSDYRFRGISLSNRKPAVQASVDVSHKSGVYAGVWGSNIARWGGARNEVDVYLGWKRSVGPLELDAGVTGYLYPGGKAVNYAEIYGYVGKTVGPASVRAGAVYAPSQKNLGHDDNLYLTGEARFGVPGTPLTLTGSAGYEDGAFTGSVGKWDWSLGAEYVMAPFTLGVSYVDTDVNRSADPAKNARAGLLGSASIEF